MEDFSVPPIKKKPYNIGFYDYKDRSVALLEYENIMPDSIKTDLTYLEERVKTLENLMLSIIKSEQNSIKYKILNKIKYFWSKVKFKGKNV